MENWWSLEALLREPFPGSIQPKTRQKHGKKNRLCSLFFPLCSRGRPAAAPSLTLTPQRDFVATRLRADGSLS